ncbi:hypothetical protein BJX70DRAFT_41827 [Aspergillus crustosus]
MLTPVRTSLLHSFASRPGSTCWSSIVHHLLLVLVTVNPSASFPRAPAPYKSRGDLRFFDFPLYLHSLTPHPGSR